MLFANHVHCNWRDETCGIKGAATRPLVLRLREADLPNQLVLKRAQVDVIIDPKLAAC